MLAWSLLWCLVLVSSCHGRAGDTPTQRPTQGPTPKTTQRPQAQVQVTQAAAPQNFQQLLNGEADLATFYDGVEHFSIDMLRRLAVSKTNVAFSPLTTWVLLALMSEGATGTTLQELKRTLSLPNEANTLHRGFGQIKEDIKKSVIGNSTVEMGSAVFTSHYLPLSPEFETIAASYYNTTLETVNFRNTTAAAVKINTWVNDLTRGHIPAIVSPGDLQDAEMVLASALYFRGTWKDSFNESQTRSEPFLDDDGNKVSDVDMMYQVGKFRISLIDSLSATALELPYSSERNSMLLLLPRRGSTLNEVLEKLGNFSQPAISTIMHKLLHDAAADQDDEDIHVYLPKFQLHTQLKLTELLKKMGVRALFQRGRAELTGLSNRNLYVSQLVHKASITVTEQGTVAAAASAAVLHNYNLPATFKANHPFLFLIVQKSTNTILFAGKVGNPGA